MMFSLLSTCLTSCTSLMSVNPIRTLTIHISPPFSTLNSSLSPLLLCTPLLDNLLLLIHLPLHYSSTRDGRMFDTFDFLLLHPILCCGSLLCSQDPLPGLLLGMHRLTCRHDVPPRFDQCLY